MKDYTDLSTTELTDLLKDRSLPTDGLKDSLISRLEAYDAVNDPSPSPELHVSPAIPPAQIPKSAPTSIPNHLPNELDEEYCLNWDDADDDDDDDAAKAITIAKAAEATKATEATESEPLKVAENSSAQPKSNSVPTAARSHSSQPSVHPSISPASVERVTKSGYKYKSIAATFFPDPPGPSATVPSNPSTPAKAFPKPPLTTPAAPTKNVTSSPCSASLTTPSKAISKPLSSAPSNALSKAPVLSTEDGSTPITPAPVIAAASSSAISKSPTLSNSGGTTTTAASAKEKATPESTINASRVKTTKSGYQFNSIASLFPSPPKAVTATPTKPTSASTKPQNIANSVANANSTYPRGVKRSLEEETQKLAKRATRFGVTTKEAEALASSKLRKHGRSAQSSAAEERDAKENEKKIEMEKEKEREKIRQRVTSTKRQRNEEDDDKRPDSQHRYNRQSQYRSPGTRANYYPRWRY